MMEQEQIYGDSEAIFVGASREEVIASYNWLYQESIKGMER